MEINQPPAFTSRSPTYCKWLPYCHRDYKVDKALRRERHSRHKDKELSPWLRKDLSLFSLRAPEDNVKVSIYSSAARLLCECTLHTHAAVNKFKPFAAPSNCLHCATCSHLISSFRAKCLFVFLRLLCVCVRPSVGSFHSVYSCGEMQ